MIRLYLFICGADIVAGGDSGSDCWLVITLNCSLEIGFGNLLVKTNERVRWLLALDEKQQMCLHWICVFTDMPSGSELCQRGGGQTFPQPCVRATGEKTEENWYQLPAAAFLPTYLPAVLTRCLVHFYLVLKIIQSTVTTVCWLHQTGLSTRSNECLNLSFSHRTGQKTKKEISIHEEDEAIYCFCLNQSLPKCHVLKMVEVFFAWYCLLLAPLLLICCDLHTS